jgi:hypothetical protein
MTAWRYGGFSPGQSEHICKTKLNSTLKELKLLLLLPQNTEFTVLRKCWALWLWRYKLCCISYFAAVLTVVAVRTNQHYCTQLFFTMQQSFPDGIQMTEHLAIQSFIRLPLKLGKPHIGFLLDTSIHLMLELGVVDDDNYTMK